MPLHTGRRPIDDEAQLRDELLRDAMATDYPIAEVPVVEDVPVPESAMTKKPLVHRDGQAEPPLLETSAPPEPEPKLDLELKGPDVSPEKYSRLSQIAYALGAGKPVPQDVLAQPKPKDEDRTALLRQALLQAKISAQQAKTAKAAPGGANAAVVDAMFALYPEQAQAIGRDRLLAMNEAELKSVMPRITSSASFGHKVGEDEKKHTEFDRRQTGVEGEREKVQFRFDLGKLDGYAKQTAELNEVASAMEEIERQAPGLMHGVVKGDVGDSLGVLPNVLGKFPLGAGKRYTPEEQQKLRSAVAMLKAVFIQSKGGKSLTEQEIAIWNNVLNSELVNTPQAQAAALDVLRRVIGNKLKKLEGGYRTIVQNPEAWEAYKLNGGLTYTGNPLWQDRGESAVREPSPGAAVPPPVASKPAAPAPATAQTKPQKMTLNGVVYELGADGQYHRSK